jgi:hypothetical protein
MGNNFHKSPKLLTKKCGNGFLFIRAPARDSVGRQMDWIDEDPLSSERVKISSAISTVVKTTEDCAKYQIGNLTW